VNEERERQALPALRQDQGKLFAGVTCLHGAEEPRCTSFPRRRESSPHASANALSRDWIPALRQARGKLFAGMTVVSKRGRMANGTSTRQTPIAAFACSGGGEGRAVSQIITGWGGNPGATSLLE
jgi:hypothetical protein